MGNNNTIPGSKMVPIVHKIDEEIENKMDDFISSKVVLGENGDKNGESAVIRDEDSQQQNDSDSEGSDEWGWNYK